MRLDGVADDLGHARSFVVDLFVGPQQADGCGYAPAHDGIAGGEGLGGFGFYAGAEVGVQVIEGDGLFQMVPLADVVPVVVVPVETTGEESGFSQGINGSLCLFGRGQEPADETEAVAGRIGYAPK